MAMALHPEKQQKAQAELDQVIGADRLPQISDTSNLPYVNAVIKETMRWHPALPLSKYLLQPRHKAFERQLFHRHRSLYF